MKKTLDPRKFETFPQGVPPLPDGWLNGFDAKTLYTASQWAKGPLLEVGSWIGRSTCCIAYGLQEMPVPLPYDVIDFGIASIAEWSDRFPGQSPYSVKDPEQILKVILHPGGTVALLKKNLVDRGLAKFVRSIYLGDLQDYSSEQNYEFVFADTMHGQAEADRNLPLLMKHLNPRDYIAIFDDVITDEFAFHINATLQAEIFALTCDSSEYSKMLVCAKGRYTDILYPYLLP